MRISPIGISNGSVGLTILGGTDRSCWRPQSGLCQRNPIFRTALIADAWLWFCASFLCGEKRASSTRRAANTKPDRRIKFQPFYCDVVPACVAKSKFTGVEASKGQAQSHDRSVSSALLCFGHRLRLKRVHPAQPADGLLVKCHDGLAIMAQPVFLFQRGETLLNKRLKMACLVHIHVGDLSFTALNLQQNAYLV